MFQGCGPLVGDEQKLITKVDKMYMHLICYAAQAGLEALGFFSEHFSTGLDVGVLY